MTRLTSHGRRGRLGLRFLHGGAPSTDCLSTDHFFVMFFDDYFLLRSDAKLRDAVYAQGQFSCDVELTKKRKPQFPTSGSLRFICCRERRAGIVALLGVFSNGFF